MLFSDSPKPQQAESRFLVRCELGTTLDDQEFQEFAPAGWRYLADLRERGIVETVYYGKSYAGLLIFMTDQGGRTQIRSLMDDDPLVDEGISDYEIIEVGPLLFQPQQ